MNGEDLIETLIYLLYKTNVKSITEIEGSSYSYTDILVHYNDNSTEIVRLGPDNKTLVSEVFLSNVSEITHLKAHH